MIRGHLQSTDLYDIVAGLIVQGEMRGFWETFWHRLYLLLKKVAYGTGLVDQEHAGWKGVGILANFRRGR